MIPYPLIFPTAKEGVVGLSLPQRVGKAKAGEYSFVEAYCVDEGCDCRRTVIIVINAKGKQVAVIEFGFDPDEPLAGPYLDEYVKQSAGAADLLQLFVDAINNNPDWMKGMYRHYKQVRKKVDGRTYRGRPFPKPGAVERFIKQPEDEEIPFAQFRSLTEAAVRTPPRSNRKSKVDALQDSLFPEEFAAPGAVVDLLELYLQEADAPYGSLMDLQNALRTCLQEHDKAASEFVELLVASFEEDSAERVNAALWLLRDALEILRVDLERQRPGTLQRMETWQAALARQVYAEGVDPHLGAMVTQVLLNARIEILPLLHEANSQRMLAGFEADADADVVADPEKALLEMLAELEEEGAGNPHEFFEAILQMMAVGDPEVQINLCRMMLKVPHPVVREAAVLMLFHPHAEVRSGVAQVIAEADGQALTPASLRRLIVARNWFPEELRGRIDQAVAGARKARVECAPLPKRVAISVYASAVDGAMAQTFQALLPEGKSFLCCSMMPKKGFGVADAFLVPLLGRRERNQLLDMLRQEAGAIESSADYLDQRVCQAIADGAEQGKVPPHWLVAIAELLGRDQWKAIPLDLSTELADLRSEIKRRGGRFVTERYRQQALDASKAWPEEQPFAWSWFEDDAEVDTAVQKALGKKRRPDPEPCLTAILERILPPRRAQWLERLVLTALWLKSARKPPVPWEQMYYVAEAVADEQVPLEEIPLMVSIAWHSFGAFMGRQGG